MHEISIVKNIFKTIEDEFPGRLDRVRTIHLTVGLLSNVQPILMQNAFDAVVADDTKYKKTSLNVTVLPILIYCDDCKTTSEVKEYKFVCTCGNPVSSIIQGDELLISKVEFED